MSILDKAKELRIRMDAEMDKVIPVYKVYNEASQKFSIVARILSELNRFERRYSFKDDREELSYFKDNKPEFYALYFYYHRLTQWTTAAAFKEPEDLVIFYREQLREIESEYNKDAETYHYLLSEESHLHQCYFLNAPLQIDHRTVGVTSYEICKGKMLSLYRLRDFISNHLNGEPLSAAFGLQWAGTRTELFEMLYALYAGGAFGKATLKKIVLDFGDLLKLDLKNYAQYLVNIKMRKERGQTFFLNSLIKTMQDRLDKE